MDIALLLGLFGLIAYCVYLVFAISGMPRGGLWLGVRAGFILTLLWDVIEIALLTPASPQSDGRKEKTHRRR